jgi:hypothetical protein
VYDEIFSRCVRGGNNCAINTPDEKVEGKEEW